MNGSGATTTAPASLPDGRRARGERTRAAIVDALLALIEEGDLRASPERIVARAGVSLRTLWTNFKDLEGLYAASNERLIAAQERLRQPIAAGAPLAERVQAFCEQRARMLEVVAPAARAAALRLPYSAQLRHDRALHRERARDELEAVFRIELAVAREREQLIRALLLTTTTTAWSMLRDDLALDVPTATAVMVRSVGALLGHT